MLGDSIGPSAVPAVVEGLRLDEESTQREVFTHTGAGPAFLLD